MPFTTHKESRDLESEVISQCVRSIKTKGLAYRKGAARNYSERIDRAAIKRVLRYLADRFVVQL